MGDQVPGDEGGVLAGAGAGFGVGSQIAGYRLEEQIGRGGMAVVFRARDERLGRPVALKILAPALAEDEAFRQRFIRESRAAAAVDDPHIIPVFEAGEASGVLFIAMRYVPGGDVRTMMNRDGPLSAAKTAAIISPVASALDAAHGAGLVHRDVKPANMLVDTRAGRPDHVYLSDFGLSKGTLSAAGLTGAGQFLGTVDYIAPEQIEGKPVDGRADEYALACAAFELLTGAPPFRRTEAMAVMYAQLSEPPPLLTSRRPDLPPGTDQVFARALAKAPENRYANCREFADALRAAFGLARYDSGPGVLPVPDHPPTRVARPGDPGAALEPTIHGDIPASRDDATDPGASTGAADDTEAQPTRPDPARPGPPPRRRHAVPVALSVLVVLIVGGVIAAVTLTGTHGHKIASFAVSAKSDFAPLDGDVFVVYRGGKDSSARLRGVIKGVTSGEVAQLRAQPFPYSRAPVPVGSVILHRQGSTAPFAFTVTPSVATRYTVELLASSTASKPLASSATRTIYVTLTGSTENAQTCSRPVCHETFHMHVSVPAAALNTEILKSWLPYFAVKLAPSKEPSPPKTLLLGAGHPNVAASQRVSATEFNVVISFSFRIGNSAFNWNWNTCLKDTEAVDGIGLPGHHGCGAAQVLASANYLG